MILKQSSPNRRKIGIWIIPVILTALFIGAFWQDFWSFMGFFYRIIAEVFDLPRNPITKDTIRSLQVIPFACLIGFLPPFVIGSFMVAAQALLPVKSLKEVYRTAWHFLLHIFGLHGPAVFVRDGQLEETTDDRRRQGPGVVAADFNSAVMLEERVLPPGINRSLFDLIDQILVLLRLYDPHQSPRICGPGVIFTRRRERIRSTLDLRKQYRFQQGVSAYTRDGLEVSANVWSIFTIGEEPDIVQVTYEGEHRAENLRLIQMEEIENSSRLRIVSLDNGLDEADRKEVHHFARAAKRMNVVIPYEALPILDNRPVFNPDRVFAAVSSQARDDENALVPWLNLPTHVAIDFFREIIGQVNFDDLYNTDDPAAFPMEIYKHQQKMVMRFNGLISYRVVYFANGRSLGSGAEFGMDEIQVSTVQPLRNPKVLRERGIKVISSQFGDIRAPDRVFQQRLEAWRARWLRDTEIVRGRYEQEAMSIRSAAQAEAQRDLYSTFARLYQDNVLNQEAIVIRVFQALERAASDPGTRNQLTPGTVQMMQALGRLILPRENRQGYED